jgi:hypothetical protein
MVPYASGRKPSTQNPANTSTVLIPQPTVYFHLFPLFTFYFFPDHPTTRPLDHPTTQTEPRKYSKITIHSPPTTNYPLPPLSSFHFPTIQTN